MAMPETRYAKSGDVHVAYQVFGDGPINLVFVPGFVSHIENLLGAARPRALARSARAASCDGAVRARACPRQGGADAGRRLPRHLDGPARAVRCARAITEAMGPLELQIRSGSLKGLQEPMELYAASD
jgi:hypothetical protein